VLIVTIYENFELNRPDGTNSKTFSSGAGGMGFKSRADQICRGDGHRSLVTPERVLSEYNEDLI